MIFISNIDFYNLLYFQREISTCVSYFSFKQIQTKTTTIRFIKYSLYKKYLTYKNRQLKSLVL